MNSQENNHPLQEKHRERCQQEATRDVIFLFQQHVLRWTGLMPDGYEMRDDSLVCKANGKCMTLDRLLEEYGSEYVLEYWRTVNVWLDRKEAETWGETQTHNYGKKGRDWQVYGVHTEGDLAKLLRGELVPPAAVDVPALQARLAENHSYPPCIGCNTKMEPLGGNSINGRIVFQCPKCSRQQYSDLPYQAWVDYPNLQSRLEAAEKRAMEAEAAVKLPGNTIAVHKAMARYHLKAAQLLSASLDGTEGKANEKPSHSDWPSGIKIIDADTISIPLMLQRMHHVTLRFLSPTELSVPSVAPATPDTQGVENGRPKCDGTGTQGRAK